LPRPPSPGGRSRPRCPPTPGRARTAVRLLLRGVGAEDADVLAGAVAELDLDGVAVDDVHHVHDVRLRGVETETVAVREVVERRVELVGDGLVVVAGVPHLVEHLVVVEPEREPEVARDVVEVRSLVVVAVVGLVVEEQPAAARDEVAERVEFARRERVARRRDDGGVRLLEVLGELGGHVHGVAVVLGVALELRELRERVVLAVALVPEHGAGAAEVGVPDVEHELLVAGLPVVAVVDEHRAEPDDVPVDRHERDGCVLGVEGGVAVAVAVVVGRGALRPHRHVAAVGEGVVGRVHEARCGAELQVGYLPRRGERRGPRQFACVGVCAARRARRAGRERRHERSPPHGGSTTPPGR
jgi:hypothetical protein